MPCITTQLAMKDHHGHDTQAVLLVGDTIYNEVHGHDDGVSDHRPSSAFAFWVSSSVKLRGETLNIKLTIKNLV